MDAKLMVIVVLVGILMLDSATAQGPADATFGKPNEPDPFTPGTKKPPTKKPKPTRKPPPTRGPPGRKTQKPDPFTLGTKKPPTRGPPGRKTNKPDPFTPVTSKPKPTKKPPTKKPKPTRKPPPTRKPTPAPQPASATTFLFTYGLSKREDQCQLLMKGASRLWASGKVTHCELLAEKQYVNAYGLQVQRNRLRYEYRHLPPQYLMWLINDMLNQDRQGCWTHTYSGSEHSLGAVSDVYLTTTEPYYLCHHARNAFAYVGAHVTKCVFAGQFHMPLYHYPLYHFHVEFRYSLFMRQLTLVNLYLNYHRHHCVTNIWRSD